MLADQIVTSAGTGYDIGGMMTSLRDGITAAQRFEMSHDAALACLELLRSKPSNLIKAQPLCRLPYPSMWIETHGGFAENHRDPNLAPIPSHQGTLIESLGDRQGFMTVCWVHKELSYAPELKNAVNASPFALYFDWRPDGNVDDLVRASHRRLLQHARRSIKTIEMLVESLERRFLANGSDQDIKDFMVNRSWWKAYANDPREIEALREHDRHMAVGLSPHGIGALIAVMTVGVQNTSAEAAAKMLRSWESDIEGEGPFAEFFIAMLNSRNCVEREPVPMAKLNKARAKRGKGPLLDYTKIKLVMSRTRQRAAEASGISREVARQHLVMGHFKIRKSGVYWWNSFIRGDASKPMERQRYEVAQ